MSELVEHKFGHTDVRRYEGEYGRVVRVVIGESCRTGEMKQWGNVSEPAELARVTRSADGCHTIELCHHGFLYPGAACEALAWALQRSIDEYKENKEQAKKDWHTANDHLREHDGIAVDLSIAEAKEAVQKSAIRLVEEPNSWGKPGSICHRPEILFRNEWWALARTDLIDDVCTSEVTRYETPEHARSAFLEKVRLGARLRLHEDGRRTFAVVDAYSDG